MVLEVMLLQLYFCQQTEASVSRCFIYSQKSLFKVLCEILDGSVVLQGPWPGSTGQLCR